MKNNVLEKIEEINKKNKLPEEAKKEIMTKIFDNLIIAVNVVMLFTILIVSTLFLDKVQITYLYNASSLVMLIFTIFVLELAYKKDSGSVAICSIEMLAFSIVILFMPYLLLKLNMLSLKFINIYVAVYYIAKVTIMYNKYRTKILFENSDIKQIIKKESKDIKAEENINDIKEKIKEKKKKESIKEETVTKKEYKSPEKKNTTKKGNSKKESSKNKVQKTDKEESIKAKSNSKNTSKTKNNKATRKAEQKVNDKNEIIQKETTPKKRGRPRKEQKQ